MSKKDNFSQAMFEMFGLGKAPEEDVEESVEELDGLELADEAEAPAAEPVAESAPAETDFPPIFEDEPIVFEEPAVPTEPFETFESVPTAASAEPTRPIEPVASSVEPPIVARPAVIEPIKPVEQPWPVDPSPFEEPVFQRAEPVKRAKCTYFAAGTSMEGTLRSDSDVEICGNFKGEIASNGKVTIHSNTTSTIAASDLVLIDCNLLGDSVVTGDVSINANSTITGNLRATNVICAGFINGNLNIQSNVTLTETAQIIGDIKTETLTTSRGAKVSGRIDIGGNR